MGISTINGGFSPATLNYWRVPRLSVLKHDRPFSKTARVEFLELVDQHSLNVWYGSIRTVGTLEIDGIDGIDGISNPPGRGYLVSG